VISVKKLLIVLFLALFVTGCTQQVGECSVQADCSAQDDCEVHCVDNACDYECAEVEEEPEVEVLAPDPVVDESTEYVVEPVEEVVEEPEYTEAELKRFAKKNLFPLEISDPRRYLSINSDIDVEKKSRDKGELRSLEFTVRNIGDEPIDVEIKALMFGFQVDGRNAKVEKDFDMPTIPPGFKYTKKYPQTIYFGDIEEEKTIELYLKEKYRDPSQISDKVIFEFMPYDKFKNPTDIFTN